MARLAYLGTPDMAVPPLRALVEAGHDIALCVTRPDRRRGRGSEVTPSPVKVAAVELGLAVSHDMDDLTAAGVELAVVVAYGRIIPVRLLEQIPMVNLHFSLLPRWRGAAPVERAILAGDHQTGVCLMKVEEGLDTGPVYAVRTVPLDDVITLDALRHELVTVASALVVEALAHGVSGLPAPVPQEGGVTTAEKIGREDLHLHWSEPAVDLSRVVRLGRAWTTFRGKRLTVLDAAPGPRHDDTGDRPAGSLDGPVVTTGGGSLVLQRVQPESRSPMSAEEWLRGVRPALGERLGTE
ncbi:MAG TPA: methionyl-tRNA formyltransferase [Acidimicrobiales bacterium]|jgi:methionyl-tRNA formyltransferase|nr:methionyl-tRNA formyltransferase [Acidimicrobiales bacterium]